MDLTKCAGALLVVAGSLLAALPAGAQGVCSGLGVARSPPSFYDLPNADIMPCEPRVMGGTGSPESMRVNKHGLLAWHFCPTPAGGWKLVWSAGTPSMIAIAAVDYALLLVATDRRAAMHAFADKHTDRPIDDPSLLPIWCPYWDEMVASAPKPVAPWWVRKAPTTANPVGTRPTFRVSAGALVADGGRVLEFAACNCAATKFPASGPTTHCSVLGQTAKLALCEARP